MPKILVLDTSTEACSVAVLNNDEVIGQSVLSPREHTQRILPMVESVLEKAELALDDLDCLAFGRGPGSFTGVRIGVGIAQGLAFGADLPMAGISTLQTMAQQSAQQHGSKHVLAAIDARMGEVYWGEFKDNGQGMMVLVGEERVIPPAELVANATVSPDVIAVGTGWAAYPELMEAFGVTPPDDILYPHAEFMLASAKCLFQQGELVTAEHATPVYLRDKVTWKKLPGRE